MYEWQKQIQRIVDEIDKCIKIHNDEALTNGYWDFWQKQSLIPGQDYETIYGLLDSIKGKLDDDGGSEPNCGSGQIMAYINDPDGRLCDWGIPRTECWGIRLPSEKGTYRRRCLWTMFLKLSILFLNIGHLIMSRKTAV